MWIRRETRNITSQTTENRRESRARSTRMMGVGGYEAPEDNEEYDGVKVITRRKRRRGTTRRQRKRKRTMMTSRTKARMIRKKNEEEDMKNKEEE